MDKFHTMASAAHFKGTPNQLFLKSIKRFGMLQVQHLSFPSMSSLTKERGASQTIHWFVMMLLHVLMSELSLHSRMLLSTS